MRIAVRDLVGGDDVLGGSENGKRLLHRLSPLAQGGPLSEVLYLDFAGIDFVSGSFLNQSALGLRDYCRQREPNLYVVVANIGEKSVQEFEEVLRLRRDAAFVCGLDETGQAVDVKLVGMLDDAHLRTLDAVRRLGETDAVQLAKAHPEEKLEQTAWNNRLRSLANRGLVMESKRGRLKKYAAVLGGK